MSPDPFEPYVPEAPPEPPPPLVPPVRAPLGTVPAAAAVPPASYVGPFDREAFPERLAAHVVEPGAVARIHGYDVAGDLARHHGASELLWLALRGELPTDAERAALDVACVLLAPVHVGQAPAHAAYVARLAGAPAGATLAIAAVGLGELIRHERETLAPWLAWLDSGGPVPACALAAAAAAADDDEAVEAQRWLDGRMRAWFGPAGGLPREPLTRLACAHALLHRLGLREPLAAETVALVARLPVVAAEAACARPGAIRSYPARLPDYQYVDGAGAAP